MIQREEERERMGERQRERERNEEGGGRVKECGVNTITQKVFMRVKKYLPK